MTKSKELRLGIQHIRSNWFSLRVKYLKLLIRIFILIHGFRGKVKKSIQVSRPLITS